MQVHGFRRLAVASIVALVLAGAPPVAEAAGEPAAKAAATERISDGSFEATTCTDLDKSTCTNPSWQKDGSSGQRQNYFCASSYCTQELTLPRSSISG